MLGKIHAIRDFICLTQEALDYIPSGIRGIESFTGRQKSYTHFKNYVLAWFSTRQEIKKRICDELFKTVPENHEWEFLGERGSKQRKNK